MIEIVGGVDDANRARLRAHHHRLRRRAAGEKMDAIEIVAIGDARGREHHVTRGQFLDRKLLLDVANAHFFCALNFFIVARRQATLKFAADTAQRRRGEHAFGRAANAKQQIDAGFRLGRRNRCRDITITDETNPRSRLAHFFDDRFMSRAGQNDNREVLDVAAFGFGQSLKILESAFCSNRRHLYRPVRRQSSPCRCPGSAAGCRRRPWR